MDLALPDVCASERGGSGFSARRRDHQRVPGGALHRPEAAPHRPQAGEHAETEDTPPPNRIQGHLHPVVL